MDRYRQVFGHKSSGFPVIGMLHLKGDSKLSMLERAQIETEIYLRNGIFPLVENYFGDFKDCKTVLDWLQTSMPESIYGVNILGDFEYSFELAVKYGAKFIQIDSVSGHLMSSWERDFADRLARCRSSYDGIVLGGVRFKYQVVASGRTVEEDLKIGMDRCDAIVVTGDATGTKTPVEKMKEFRDAIGDFPLIVGAGVTPDMKDDVKRYCDGAIVGSYFKQFHQDFGDVQEAYVKEIVNSLR